MQPDAATEEIAPLKLFQIDEDISGTAGTKDNKVRPGQVVNFVNSFTVSDPSCTDYDVCGHFETNKNGTKTNKCGQFIKRVQVC